MEKGLREVINEFDAWLEMIFRAGGVLFSALVDTITLPLQLLAALLA